MTFEAVAVCPGTPLLCPQVAVSPDGVVTVQAAAREAVAALVAAEPGEVVVVGDAPRTTSYDGSWDWHGFGVHLRGPGSGSLPRALGVGAWLLDDAGWTDARRYIGVSPAASPTECATLGRLLREDGGPRALLVIGDGSAKRTVKAPGHFDERAEPFDDAVAHALDDADLEALQALDADLATELMAAGRAPWQVLAAAAADEPWAARLLLHEAPYGVAWLVAEWHRAAGKHRATGKTF